MMSKDAASVNKREKILQASVKVFSSKGFHEAKVEEIAKVADVGKGTVYEYFSSKVELFQEMFRAGMEFYQRQMDEQLQSQLNAEKKLREMARIHLEFVLDYKDLAKVTMMEHAHFNQEFHDWLFEMREQKISVVEGIIAEGVKSGEFRSNLDCRAVAIMFIGMMGAIFGPAVFGGQESKLEETVDQMMEIMIKGIIS